MRKGSLKNGINRNAKKFKRVKEVNSEAVSDDNVKFLIGIFVVVFTCATGYWSATAFDDQISGMVDNTIDNVIRNIVNLANLTLEQNQKFQMVLSILDDDSVLVMIGNKLRLIQDRLGSLKTQTSQYKKLQHIRVEPTSFIQSSFRELDQIIAQLHDYSMEGMMRETAKRKASIELTKKQSELRAASEKFFQLESVQLLIRKKAPYILVEDMEVAIEAADEGEITLEQATQALLRLALMYERLRKTEMKVLDIGRWQLGLETLDEIRNFALKASEEAWNTDKVVFLKHAAETHKKLRKEIEEEQETNEIVYNVFWVLKSRLENVFTADLTKRMQEDQNRIAQLVDLSEMIRKNIRILKKQIMSLQTSV